MRELPTGTVTFLFTDIEGSTKLLHELGDEYADALAEHRRLLRDAFTRHGGVEVDTQGDAFFVAFRHANDALAAAQEGQQALSGPIKVRMGLHTGEPLVTDEGYVGIEVHRAARIAAAGHGGQVVVSETTAESAEASLELEDLGLHRLKDLAEPTKLFQLGAKTFPPLRSLNATNLPTQPTPLVGRTSEVTDVSRLLTHARLVTLTGSGGSGKTRLALHVAAELVDRFKDGVFWVSLASLSDPELVIPTIAATIGAKDDLARAIEEKRMMLLLDNLEQVPGCAPALAELLRRCPNLTILATSRAPLRIADEYEYDVPPLPETDAVQLFVESAQKIDRTFEADDHVVAICRRLDGLPLAIELAAARTRTLAPSKLAERLDAALAILVGGGRDAPVRQQTLRATIEWSYELLDARQKELFAALSTFAGSFDLEAAEAVCSADVDALESLLESSLLRRWASGRFGMLETIREFARERSDVSRMTAELRDQHLAFFTGRMEREREGTYAAPSDVTGFYRRVQLEEANIRSALEWALERQANGELVRLVATTWRLFWLRGYHDEGRKWAERALATGVGDAMTRAYVAAGGTALAASRGDFQAAEKFAQESLRQYEGVGDVRWISAALRDLSSVYWLRGEVDRAAVLAERALAAAEGEADPDFTAPCVGQLGQIELDRGNIGRARELSERALELARQSENSEWITLGHIAIGFVELHSGQAERAELQFEEALSLTTELRFREGEAISLCGLGAAAAGRGDAVRAARLLGCAARICSEDAIRLGRIETRLFDDVEQAVAAAVGESAAQAEITAGAELEPSSFLTSHSGDATRV